ncbi:MAG: hypothetical protein JJV95_07105 [Sulfurospirillum sp.]|nr:hypothetical protein [Sulfurospirillum sp.]MBL0703728.1 hypothetical protein [Sulfurospirillum sp.]
MEKTGLIVFLVGIMLVIVIFILIIIFFSMKKSSAAVKRRRVKKAVKSEEVKVQHKKEYTIDDMLELVSDRNLSKSNLVSAINKMAKEFVFPRKFKGQMPEGAKKYLSFILLVASHKNADAKVIATMNATLKKVNKDYYSEIEMHESEGVRQREK